MPAECSGRCAASWATFYAECARRIAAAPNHADLAKEQRSSSDKCDATRRRQMMRSYRIELDEGAEEEEELFPE